VDASHGLPVVADVADAGDDGRAVVVGDVTSPRGMERVLRLGRAGSRWWCRA
jgi:hypothetical protein